MVIGVRVEQELERQLDQVVRQQGKSHSACIREAIRPYLLRHGDGEEARRQSEPPRPVGAAAMERKGSRLERLDRMNRDAADLAMTLHRGTVVTVASPGVYSGT